MGPEIQKFLEAVSSLLGQSPNQDFGVGAPPPDLMSPQPVGDLGLSPGAAATGEMLNTMQGAGIQPPMPGEVGGGYEAKSLIFDIIKALMAQKVGESQQQMGDPAVFQSGASVGSEGNKELLLKLLEGS